MYHDLIRMLNHRNKVMFQKNKNENMIVVTLNRLL